MRHTWHAWPTAPRRSTTLPRRRSWLSAWLLLAWLIQLAAPATALAARPNGPAAQIQPVCFQETGFCIESTLFQDYFRQRGGTRILGFPVSREFTLEGFRVQFFQRVVLQLQGNRVERLNLLDPAIMPVTRANQSTFPAVDPATIAGAPDPASPDYGQRVIDFVRRTAPDTWNGLPVRFFNLFNTTVPVDIAFGGAPPNPGLVTLLNLEIWGLPTGPPAFDPSNRNFVYQRFQRGIMHFRADCVCTDGILVGDYFKAVITGRGLPPDLAADMGGSRYYRQYNSSVPNWVARPELLPTTNLTGAFEPGLGPVFTRPKLTIPSSDLQRLSSVLAAHGLAPKDVNVARTVTAAVPAGIASSQGSATLMMAAPLVLPPTADTRDLTAKAAGVPIGVLEVGRSLSLADQTISSLPPDIYLVIVRGGQMIFTGSTGKELAPPSMKMDLRTLTRQVDLPEAILTAQDMCYSWNHVQVCSGPAPSRAFTAEESSKMAAQMETAVRQLANQLGGVEINTDEVLPDVEGRTAVDRRQASILAAAAASFPAAGQEVANGAILGVVNAVLDVDVPGYPTIPRGVYAVRAVQTAPSAWKAQFVAADGKVIEVPAALIEMRGQIERPMVMIVNLRIGLCFFEC